MNKPLLKIEKEKELLALMICKPESCIEISQQIPNEMISDKHREIFKAISELKEPDSSSIVFVLQKFDYTNVKEILDLSSTILPNVSLRISEFYDISDSINADNLLSGLLEKSKKSLLGLDILSDLKNKVDEELSKYSQFEKTFTFDESLDEIIARIESSITKDNATKLNSFPSFNTATGGLYPGNLTAIAGAFKNGKTSFALNLILDLAAQNIPSAIFSLEMSRKEVEDKIISFKSGISYEKIRNPQRLEVEEQKELLRFRHNNKNSNEKLFIYDKIFTMSGIETTVRKLKAKYDLKVLMLDYIGLVKSISKNRNPESREREISMLSNSLKILAKETDTIIFVLSQLNRSGIREASSFNLAESIALARDCDFLFTIFKPDVHGYNNVKIGNRTLEIGPNDFIVTLDSSRHSQAGKQFVLRLSLDGEMKEIETRFDNSYMSKDQVPASYYESEEHPFL